MLKTQLSIYALYASFDLIDRRRVAVRVAPLFSFQLAATLTGISAQKLLFSTFLKHQSHGDNGNTSKKIYKPFTLLL